MNFAISRARKRLHIGRTELTPMIDVIFLLLVFFLVSTTQAPPESELAPALQAQKEEAGSASDFEPQVLEVLMVGGEAGFRLGDRVVRTQEELELMLRELPKEPGIFVKCADEVRARWAAAAVQACRDAGFRGVTYVPAR